MDSYKVLHATLNLVSQIIFKAAEIQGVERFHRAPTAQSATSPDAKNSAFDSRFDSTGLHRPVCASFGLTVLS